MSVYRRKDGYWRVEVSATDPFGNRKRHFASARTRKEALQKEIRLNAEANGMAAGKLTLKAIAEDYFRQLYEDRRLSTVYQYRSTYRNHIEKELGEMILERIGKREIVQWKRVIDEDGRRYSIVTKRHCYKVLRCIFTHAYTEFGIKNPALQKAGNFHEDPNAVTEQPKLHYWTPAQFSRWLSAIGEEVDRMPETDKSYPILSGTMVIVSVCYFCGMRKGEANALRLSDYHRGETPFLRVSRSVSQQLGIGSYLTTNPKTRESARDVPVCSSLSEILDRHIERYLSRTGLDDPYLGGGLRPVSNQSMRENKDRIESKAGVPHIRIHDLRHSFVTMMISGGVDMSVIAKLCGHSSTKTTFATYGHLLPATASGAIRSMEEFYEKEKEGGENEQHKKA